jgi:hypothetical protein
VTSLRPGELWLRLLLRSVGFWTAVRLALVLVPGMGTSPPASHQLNAGASAVAVATVVAISWVHARAMKERLFLANLGIGPAALLVPFAAAVLLEVLARVIFQ